MAQEPKGKLELGNGGLGSAGDSGPITEPDKSAPPVLEEWGSEDEMQASVSGGVGDPILDEEAMRRAERQINDPGRKRWWEPHVDGNNEPVVPHPRPDAAIMEALSRDAMGAQFLDSLIDAEGVELPRNMQVWPQAVKTYDLLTEQYLELLRTKKREYVGKIAFGDQSHRLLAKKLAILLIYAVGHNHLPAVV